MQGVAGRCAACGSSLARVEPPSAAWHVRLVVLCLQMVRDLRLKVPQGGDAGGASLQDVSGGVPHLLD